jgi:hypothetical protein
MFYYETIQSFSKNTVYEIQEEYILKKGEINREQPFL